MNNSGDFKTNLINVVKRVSKVILKVVGFFVIPAIILAACAVYIITIADGTYKDKDWSSTPYASSEFVRISYN